MSKIGNYVIDMQERGLTIEEITNMAVEPHSADSSKEYGAGA